MDTRLSKIAKGDTTIFSHKDKSQHGLPTIRLTKGLDDVGDPMRMYVPISKIDEEKRMVFGIACSPTLDKQDEIVEWDATKAALAEFKKFGRNLREMHRDDSAAGTIPIINEDDTKKTVDIGAKVVDDQAWRKVKEGVYKGFSIGGRALSRIKEFSADLGKNISKVKEFILNEISLVDRPANPDCVFTMVKRDSSFADPLRSEIEGNVSKYAKLEKYILSDDDVQELPDKQFALVRKYSEEGKNYIERCYPVPDKPHARAALTAIMKDDLSDREKELVHSRCMKVLGDRHDPKTCPYCAEVNTLVKLEGGEKREMAKAKLADIKKHLRSLQSRLSELEGVEKPVSDQVESEDLKDAPQEQTKTSGTDPLEGSKYSDVEGLDLDGLLAELEGWEGDEGYQGEEDLGDAEENTHIFDDESEVSDNKDSPDSEDNEGIDDDDLDEEGTEVGKAEVCPYCPTALRLIAKGEALRSQCPMCGTVYEAEAGYRVGLSKSGGERATIRKSESDNSDMTGVLASLTKVTGNLAKRLIGLEDALMAVPAPRKATMVKRAGEGDSEDNLQKMEDDTQKALALVKQAAAERRELTPAEKMQVDSTLNKRLDAKLGRS